MDPGEGHLVASVTVSQVLPVLGFPCLLAIVAGHGNIRFIADVRRIGEGPQIFRLGQALQLFLDHAVIRRQRLHGFGGAFHHRRVDLHLILAEVPDDMLFVGEGIGRVGQEAVFINAQAFPFQTEISQ